MPDTMDCPKEFRIYIAGPKWCKFNPDHRGQHAYMTDRPLEDVASEHIAQNPAMVFSLAQAPEHIRTMIADGFRALPNRESRIPTWASVLAGTVACVLAGRPGIALAIFLYLGFFCFHWLAFARPTNLAFKRLAAAQKEMLNQYGIDVIYQERPKMLRYIADSTTVPAQSQQPPSGTAQVAATIPAATAIPVATAQPPPYAAPQVAQTDPHPPAVGLSISVMVPEGAVAGSVMDVPLPEGGTLEVTVPPGVAPGSTIQVQYSHQPPATV